MQVTTYLPRSPTSVRVTSNKLARAIGPTFQVVSDSSKGMPSAGESLYKENIKVPAEGMPMAPLGETAIADQE